MRFLNTINFTFKQVHVPTYTVVIIGEKIHNNITNNYVLLTYTVFYLLLHDSQSLILLLDLYI